MLIAVLSITFFLSIVGLAILGLVVTTSLSVNALSTPTRTINTVDGEFERVVNEIRNDASMVNLPCSRTWSSIDDPDSTNTIQIECTSPVAPSSERRIVDLVASYESSGDVIGHARVLVTDEVLGVAAPGYSLTVCDWILGADLSSEELRGCPS